QTDLLFQPVGEIIGHAMQAQTGLNEVVVDGMHADLVQAVQKSAERVRGKVGGKHHQVGGAEIKGLMGRMGTRAGVALEKLANNLKHAAAKAFKGREFPDVHAGQLLRQSGLVTGREGPVGEVVRKALPDKVML